MFTNSKELGKQIATLRKKEGLSQVELAKLSGIPVIAIRRCEQNGAIPLDRYVALAKLLKAQVEIVMAATEINKPTDQVTQSHKGTTHNINPPEIREPEPVKRFAQTTQPKNRPATLATKLGTTTHTSLLLRKFAQLGLDSPEKLAAAAIRRGCNHYSSSVTITPGKNPEEHLVENSQQASNEELAMALLSPCLPYEPQWIRIGAQLLSAPSNNPQLLARLAIQDRSAPILKYIAQCGKQTEPELPFWTEILKQLEIYQPAPANVVSHISRFRIETGVTDPRTPTAPKIVWLRPNPKKHLDEQPA